MAFVYSCLGLFIIKVLMCTHFIHCRLLNFAETPFISVWNSPSKVCDKVGISLNLSYFDIVANTGDTFEGDEIVIFYENRLGLYPRIDADGNYINGGLPQLANVPKHLAQVSVDVSKYIPNRNFTGLVIIDWESWRPIFDRNGYNQPMKIYIEASKNHVRNEHPDWPEDKIETEARVEFENGARTFMLSTLKACKKLRPEGLWGFYGFPNCYNTDNERFCTNNTMQLNDRLSWLFHGSTSLYPSIYLNEEGAHAEKYNRVYGQLKEALRMKKAYGGQFVPIFAYTRYRYGDSGQFYDMADLNSTIRQVAEAGLNGVALWDSSASFRNARVDCSLLRDYLDTTLGPFVRNITLDTRKCSKDYCNTHGRCIITNWKRKSITNENITFQKSPYRPLFLRFIDKIIGTFHALYDFYWSISSGKAKSCTAEWKSYTDHSQRSDFKYSCDCYVGWTGQHCDRRSKSNTRN